MQHLPREFPLSWFLNFLILVPPSPINSVKSGMLGVGMGGPSLHYTDLLSNKSLLLGLELFQKFGLMVGGISRDYARRVQRLYCGQICPLLNYCHRMTILLFFLSRSSCLGCKGSETKSTALYVENCSPAIFLKNHYFWQKSKFFEHSLFGH